MNVLDGFYPQSPQQAAASATEPSPLFKKEVKKVMGTIVLFFLVYFILIALSIALAILCIGLGIGVIAGLASFIGLALGLGIISIGIMVFVFLVKFIFSVKKYDTSGSIAITETEQPRLFAFIRQLTEETQTTFPKKIILSPDVNACVFYNDSFWSMIFPVRKNLQIGLGLVNTLTISEFKAVMAHEFGHFSQKSMKLGSFVYNVNKVIYNMLFENKNYSAFLQGWGNLHWAIGIFVHITIALVRGIQTVLQKMYGFINRNYMGLSRQMEFHADAVAASVSGSTHLITALQKLEISDTCYNAVIQRANEWLTEKKVLQNIYTKHHVVMAQYAHEYKLPLLNGVPLVSNSFFKDFQQSKINIKDQWASHPSREDRETHLMQLNIDAVTDNRPSWLLFNEPGALQAGLTNVIYADVPKEMKEGQVDEESFKTKFLTDVDIYNLPEAYVGYYDNHQPAATVFSKVFDSNTDVITEASFDKLFNIEKTGLIKALQANRSDAQILEAIANNSIDVKTFDYNGEKYNQQDAAEILKKLQEEIQLQDETVKKNDEAAATFFYNAAKIAGEEEAKLFKEKYLWYSINSKNLDAYTGSCNHIIDLLSPLLQNQKVTIEQANEMAAGLGKESDRIKPLLADWLQGKVFDDDIVLKEKITQFNRSTYLYFSGDSFFDSELGQIHSLVKSSMKKVVSWQMSNFKKLLQYQLDTYNKVPMMVMK